MNGKRSILVVVAGAWLAANVPAHAHAVRHVVSEGATAVRWHYDDGRPLAGGHVVVTAPGDPGEPYLVGEADARGVFAFLPDTNGRWTVTLEDGMGHRADVYIDVDPASASPVMPVAEPQRFSGIVVGVSAIFGCFGLYAMFTERWRRRRVPA